MTINHPYKKPKLSSKPTSFPFTSNKMIDAALYLAKAIAGAKKNEARFVLFGDFDVDGTASAAIMSLYMRLYGVDAVSVFVSRRKDGYGLSLPSLERLLVDLNGVHFKGTTYVILMDLGVNTVAEAEVILKAGSKSSLSSVIVIDHHVPTPTARDEWDRLDKAYPGRVMAYDPLLFEEADERYFRCLSAAGLVQRLHEVIIDSDIDGLGKLAMSKIPASLLSDQGVKKTISRRTILNTIDKIAAIAQASDVMPFAIDGELTAAWAMAKKFEDTSGTLLAGVTELYKKTNTASRIGWVIGPILNAAGRLEDAYASFDIMTEIVEGEARSKMEAIELTRTKVQTITAGAWTSLDDCLRTDAGVAVLVMDGSQIGSGIVGITASRACDKFGRPSVCLIESEDSDGRRLLKGSMRRGQTTFSCEAWILELKLLGIAVSGGGHPAAAGMSILASRYDDFIAHALLQTFNSTVPPVYQTNVVDTHTLLRDVETIMPFGNGNAAPRLRVEGVLIQAKPLIRKDDGMVWCYVLTIGETNDHADSFETKVMARDLSLDAAQIFIDFARKPVDLPIIVDVEAFDGLRAGFSTRGEYRVVTTITSQHTVDNAPLKWLDLSKMTESGSFAHIRIRVPSLTPPAPDVSAASPRSTTSGKNTKSSDGAATLGSGDTTRSMNGNVDESTAASETTTDDVTSTKADDVTSTRRDDIEMISEFLAASTENDQPYKVTCTVDFDDRLAAGTFLVKKPAKNEIVNLVGEDGLEAISAAHGGKWASELKGYIIAAGTIVTLKPSDDGLYNFIYTKRAIKAAADIDAINKQIIANKSNTEIFDVPFLREGKTPFGFQYADVRVFLARDVSLCYNDMGTGKTFEAALWGAMHYAASVSAFDIKAAVAKDNLSELVSVMPAGVPSLGDPSKFVLPKAKPVLVATMASIATQFSGELESFLTLKSVVLTTEFINECIEASGVKLTKKEKSVNQLKNPNPKLAAYFIEHVASKNAFVVATYDCLSRHPWIVSMVDWSGVICDEAHELKGSSTHKTRAIFGEGIDRAPLSRAGGYIPVLAMSGTFPKNRPGDWFVWVRLTEADYGVYTGGVLGEAQRRFDRRFDGLCYKEIWLRRGGGPPRKITVPDKGPPEHGDEIKAILAPNIIRRLKDEIEDLPTMRVHVKRVPSHGLYLDVLANIRTGQSLSVKSKDLLRHHHLLSDKDTFLTENPEEEETRKAVKASTLAGRLSMVSSLDKASGVVSTLTSMEWIGPQSNDEALAIVVFHRSALKEVSRQLDMAGVSHFTMSQEDTIEEREAKKKAFQAGERTAFVTTFGVGGTGLNLTRASRMAMVGLPWTDTALAQARDRIFRIGQRKSTSIVILLLSASIDESTYFLIKHKGRANFKTASVDKLRTKGVQLPAWATGSVLDHTDRPEETSDKSGESPKSTRPGSSWLT